MAKKLTWSEFPSRMVERRAVLTLLLDAAEKRKLARAIMVEAALDLTRMKRKTRRACMLVLVEGEKPAAAAMATGQTRQHVHDSLVIARKRLAEVERESRRDTAT